LRIGDDIFDGVRAHPLHVLNHHVTGDVAAVTPRHHRRLPVTDGGACALADGVPTRSGPAAASARPHSLGRSSCGLGPAHYRPWTVGSFTGAGPSPPAPDGPRSSQPGEFAESLSRRPDPSRQRLRRLPRLRRCAACASSHGLGWRRGDAEPAMLRRTSC
jgi:hypothetical protein